MMEAPCSNGRDAAKETVAEDVDQNALEREEGGGGEGSAHGDGGGVGEDADQAGEFGADGERSVPKMLVPDEDEAEKNGDCEDSCEEESLAEIGRTERTKMSRTSGNSRSHS